MVDTANPAKAYGIVPVAEAAALGAKFEKDVVCIVTIDRTHGKTHFTTWGNLPADKVDAAQLADFIAQQMFGKHEQIRYHDFRALGVARLVAEVERLRGRLAAIGDNVDELTKGPDADRPWLIVQQLKAALNHVRADVDTALAEGLTLPDAG